ncbi:hypothetical protein GQ55_5G087600 [Panicum hallii var. hallii]|uniref:Uncharacterized protein n=1 Tax=Panicum hallii var. hallii TaxID=1504633 RepID=A0A2T7DE76_9POAL|nr:hypothetical protein GQ55_5G087600 [Panicum hallii var. hallii]
MRVVDDHRWRRRGLLPPTAVPRRRAVRGRNTSSSSSCFPCRRRRRPERPEDAHPRSPVEPRGRPPGAPQQASAARASPLPRPLPVRRRPPAGSGRQGDHGRGAADLSRADPCAALAPLPPHRRPDACSEPNIVCASYHQGSLRTPGFIRQGLVASHLSQQLKGKAI